MIEPLGIHERTARAVVVATALFIAAACSAADPPLARLVARSYDSAGITIVMNGEPTESDLATWTIDTVPSVQIGLRSGDEPYLFSRVVGSMRLGDGSFVIGDAESSEIRVFDSTGVFVRKFGRVGSGPGEYINFDGVRRYPGDSIFVIDYEGLRAHVVAPDGKGVRRFSPRLVDNERHKYSTPDLIGIFNDGTMLVGDPQRRCAWDPISATIDPRLDAAVPAGYCDDSTAIYRLSESGKAVANFGTFLSSRSLTAHTSGGRRAGLSDITAPLFLRQFGDRFYYVDAEQPEIRVYHRERGLTHIFRIPDTREATVPKLGQPSPRSPGGQVTTWSGGTLTIEYLVESSRPFVVASNEERAQAFASIRQREFARYFQAMQIDLDGNIWLEDAGTEPSGIGMYGTKRWYIFDSTGVLTAKLTAPNAFVIGTRLFSLGGREIGSHYILVQRNNDDGAPVLRMHRIHKQGAGRK